MKPHIELQELNGQFHNTVWGKAYHAISGKNIFGIPNEMTPVAKDMILLVGPDKENAKVRLVLRPQTQSEGQSWQAIWQDLNAENDGAISKNLLEDELNFMASSASDMGRIAENQLKGDQSSEKHLRPIIDRAIGMTKFGLELAARFGIKITDPEIEKFLSRNNLK